ncbi:MAG TPA: energy-coupling factor ABC transporter permease [Casimicrobiaceae bacterium]|nr:energy-coupling factor ABC transporter permease [Casimicrobiaceae bacterium]
MDLSDLPLPVAWRLAGWALALPVLAAAAWRGDWSRRGENEPVHVFLGTLAALVALWSLRATAADIGFHLLGTAGLALATGLPRALVGGAVVVAATTLLRDAPWANAALVWLTLVALPATVVTLVLEATQRWLPPNFFVYVFGAAFAGSAVALAAGGLAGATLALAAGGKPAEAAVGDIAAVLLSLAFGEGTLTGMLVTLAVVYRPQWVATFDDRRYLGRRP